MKERLLERDVVLGYHSEQGIRSKFVCFSSFRDWISKLWKQLRNLISVCWEFGRSDTRKAIFSAKMGLALTVISLLIFWKDSDTDTSRYSVWAIITVPLVFEFSIGETLNRGLNRALGTMIGGGLALGIAELSILTGRFEELFILLSIFIAGFLATFMKFYPTLKPYEYGFRIFMLTYSIIMVSCYETREFIHMAVARSLLIALGASVSLVVNICIYPIWSGEELHNLVVVLMGIFNVSNMRGFLRKILTYQASDDPLYKDYRTAVESASQEENLGGFATWEPPHGPYKMMRYPWKNYIKVSGALRHSAFMVMALHGCLLSEIQAPPERRQVFSAELLRVGIEGAKVLRELGNKVKAMVKLNPGDILFVVHEAAEELQKKIDRQSYLLVNSDCWEIGNRTVIIKDAKADLNTMQDEGKPLAAKSTSEEVLDLGPPALSKNWSVNNSSNMIYNSYTQPEGSPETKFQKHPLWPPRQSFRSDGVPSEVESQTYESASALSLATFASLLIEFVARLQNVVDSFEELSEVAKFKESVSEPGLERVGFWTRLSRCLRFSE
ncbi:Aluminum-activated malate transporter [Cinnamomum micranthum f. kanehirae]|uniref:Aluminum-activated malate transporter n=1 Tax=Cinnamomum micranthum f. kanehirae TaxID=337451 RepID=A0A443N3C3_9MAGN|nr:Aluminum-activated malate transporter [Cinnamomum micranthum f. kanehirae]